MCYWLRFWYIGHRRDDMKNLLKKRLGEGNYSDILPELREVFNLRIMLGIAFAILAIAVGWVCKSFLVVLLLIFCVIIYMLIVFASIVNVLNGNVFRLEGKVLEVFDAKSKMSTRKKILKAMDLNRYYIRVVTAENQIVTIYYSNSIKIRVGDIVSVYFTKTNCIQKSENSYVINSPYHVGLIKESMGDK